MHDGASEITETHTDLPGTGKSTCFHVDLHVLKSQPRTGHTRKRGLAYRYEYGTALPGLLLEVKELEVLVTDALCEKQILQRKTEFIWCAIKIRTL